MSKNKTPILEILKLVKNNIILVLIAFLLTIYGSFYYNQSFKQIKYKYKLDFDLISEWETEKLKLRYREVISLARNSIFSLLKQHPISDYDLVIEGKKQLILSSLEPLKIENTINNINQKIKNNIKYSVEKEIDTIENIIVLKKTAIKNRIDKLEKEREKLVSNFKRSLTEKVNSTENQIFNLNKKKDFLDRNYSFYLNNPLGISNDNSEDENLSVGEIINLKNIYLDLIEEIGKKEELLEDLQNEELFVDNTYNFDIDVRFPNFQKKILEEIDDKITNLKKELNTILDETDLYELNSAYNDFDFENKKFFYSVLPSEWEETNNLYTKEEIILIGIFFGLLLNCFLLFLKSEYFRKSIK